MIASTLNHPITSGDKSPILFPKHSHHCICAASGSGKTYYMLKMLKNIDYFFEDPPKKIIYVYKIYQSIFDDFKNVEFIQDLPTIDQIASYNPLEFKLIILDDLTSEIVNNNDWLNFFCVGAHHMNFCVFYLKQSIFEPGKYSRLINLQTHIFHLFENKRDSSSLVCLARQIMPGNNAFFMDAYKKCITTKFNPLIIDMHPQTNEKYMFRSHIFDKFPTIYIKA